MENACIHIYTGDGKGKTTAAVGLCYRCARRGFKVGITSFLKDFDSGEYLGEAPFHIFYGRPLNGFWFSASDEEKDVAKTEAKARLYSIFKQANEENYDLVALDEIFGAISVGMIEELDLINLLRNKPKCLEIVLTGREPSAAICELADYISEIKEIKHPYTRGLTARLGIEK